LGGFVPEPLVARPVTRRAFVGGVGAVAMSSLVGCRATGRQEYGVTTSTSPRSLVGFPQPTDGSVPVESALRRRRSVREFGAEPLTDEEIGQLLWAAQGVTAEWGGRTAPSAGALYPLELHAVTPSRALHYLPDGHRAEVTAERDLRPELMDAALDQEAVGQAPLVVVIVAVPARTATRYGDRAGRYVDLEAGHAAQNVLLQAVALDLVAVPIGAFDDEAVADVLALPAGHEPRYLLPVGHPAGR
jgi:SagB-type dehydrogenase family enzyme